MRWVQDPVTLRLVPAAEWHAQREVPRTHLVMPDVPEHRSMLTGEMVRSRSRHRNLLREHGVEEVGNEVGHHMALREARRAPHDSEGLRRTIAEALKRHGGQT